MLCIYHIYIGKSTQNITFYEGKIFYAKYNNLVPQQNFMHATPSTRLRF